MKRMVGCLVALMLCFSAALAVPDVPYSPDTLLRYHRQTPEVQRLVDVMYEGAMNFRGEVELPPNSSYDDAEQAFLVLLSEFPELFQLSGSIRLQYYQHTPDICNAVTFSYVMDEAAYVSLRQQMMDAALWFIPVHEYDPFRISLHLHDALAARTTYPDDMSGQHNYEAYGALLYGSSVCEGYAHALTLLYRLAGIPCSMIVGTAYSDGTAGSHAWNVVELGGELFLTDCTFNDQDEAGKTLHWYFNLPAADMASTHFPDQQEYSISSSRQYTYHMQTNGWIGTVGDIERVFLAQVERSYWYACPIELRCADAVVYQALLDSISTLIGTADIGSVQYFTNDELFTVSMIKTE